MPTIESSLQSLLGALVSGRCFPIINNSATIVLPYITFQVIAATPLVVTEDGAVKERMRVQIDVWDKTYGGAKTIAASVKAAMNSTSAFASAEEMNLDGYEEATKEYRVILEYIIWP